jgi:elongator complex protein 1
LIVALFAGDPSTSDDRDFPDDVSLAPTDASTSGETFMTRYTGRSIGTLNTQTTRRTSKHKRREERKRARGKKGSVYEEEYIINSIGRLIERINSIHEDIFKLVAGLVRRQMREQAGAIERAMIEIVEMCNSIVSEVYELENASLAIKTQSETIQRSTGGDAVLQDAVESSKMQKVAPPIKKFERLFI